MRLYYAQNREDLLIKAFFPDVKKGFYIDVGANDPVIDSVTKLLYDEGWHGINVEPIPRHFRALQKARPRDINLHIGLGRKADKLAFTEYPEGDGLSTFDKSTVQLYESRVHSFPTKTHKTYQVEVKTLQQVVAELQPTHIHFIKIDVEGYEFEVISGYDWKTVRPELICIEADHIRRDWRELLQKNKYHEVFFDGINNYYLAKESLSRREHFNYADAVISGDPVYYAAWQKEEEKHQKIVKDLRNKLAEKEQEIAFLHQQQRDVRFLAKRLTAETQTRLNRRAKTVTVTERLCYGQSRAADKALQDADTMDKFELLRKVHDLDAENIHIRRLSVKDKVKPAGWKVAAGTFNSSVGLAKKIQRYGK